MVNLDNDKKAKNIHDSWRDRIKEMLKHSQEMIDGSALVSECFINTLSANEEKYLKPFIQKKSEHGWNKYIIPTDYVKHFTVMSSIEYEDLPEFRKKVNAIIATR